ncbi:phage virion morphogenesis protein, partial [Accumulibacter sp.]|uniref:phage virion morphogenesis protein n=1 Tax=Accumulibacter sp. TaxID=2053492 RepID=UPI0025E239AE
MIEIKVDTTAVTQALERLARSAADTSPVMRAIAGVMHDAVMENFQQGGRPAWVPLKPATLAQKRKLGYGDKPLIRRGGGQSLYSSITSRSDQNSAVVGTDVVYAAIHQFGGRTAPHVIKPRNKKALAWPGIRHPVRSVNHPGSLIPARPFLSLTDADEQKIVSKISDYLARAVGG